MKNTKCLGHPSTLPLNELWYLGFTTQAIRGTYSATAWESYIKSPWTYLSEALLYLLAKNILHSLFVSLFFWLMLVQIWHQRNITKSTSYWLFTDSLLPRAPTLRVLKKSFCYRCVSILVYQPESHTFPLASCFWVSSLLTSVYSPLHPIIHQPISVFSFASYVSFTSLNQALLAWEKTVVLSQRVAVKVTQWEAEAAKDEKSIQSISEDKQFNTIGQNRYRFWIWCYRYLIGDDQVSACFYSGMLQARHWFLYRVTTSQPLYFNLVFFRSAIVSWTLGMKVVCH